jgi:putative endonuclease
MAKHNELGKKGEQLAKNHIKNNGGLILDLNWRYLKAEIDIIFQEKNSLIFVEVKTRSTSYFGNPEEFVSAKKQQLFKDAAEQYLHQKNLNYEVRFDVIAIVIKNNKPNINHIKDAF